MADILNISELGRLEIVEVYDYYDQPILFSCKNAAGHLYLVVAADENDRHEIWLYAGISTERLNLIRSGAIDLHDAFAEPEAGFLLQVIVPYNDPTQLRTETIQPDQISVDMFPTPGERLDLETETLPQFQEETTPAFPVTGTLTGAFLSSKRFEIETTEKTYTGSISDEAVETVENATLSQTYTAMIQEITERSETTGKTKTKHQLLSLSK